MEKIKVEASIPFLSSTVSISELKSVIRQVGHTSEDRYRILEARDRLMRLKQTKVHTLDTAKVTIGTCPDMCPEKERLMREFQRQVAAYELEDCDDYKINHETAVKQYSRSSADQEEPMPQDLRPVSSLKMTMSYLLHVIVDVCEEEGANLAEWYHFLWDRTRGIRKDITQQELCCIETVELVEQCARFHIICSERLCAEELSVFDDKINTENLTKCLQTLKYMYHDLRVNGIVCKNEPEFRAYIILLNLNNANFMWDLQRLPTNIQKSAEVNFALRVYFAIQSNNYAKFFKLVAATTYLNACLLLRYFLQVRVQALSVMVKAYYRTTSTAYPLYEFIDILGFEDESEATYFCEQSGLNISNDELYIILNRQNLTLPPPMLPQGRAKNLVESKRVKKNHSFGQVIAGELMPEQMYLNHVPHNSFDKAGYLKSEAIDAKDQNRGLDSIKNPQHMDEEEEEEEEEEGEEEEREDGELDDEEEGTEDPYEFMDADMPEKSPILNAGLVYSKQKLKIASKSDLSNVIPPVCKPEGFSTGRSPPFAIGHKASSSHAANFGDYNFRKSIFTKQNAPMTTDTQEPNIFSQSIPSSTGAKIPVKSDNIIFSTQKKISSPDIFGVAPNAEVFAKPVPILPVLTPTVGKSVTVPQSESSIFEIKKLDADGTSQSSKIQKQEKENRLHAIQLQEMEKMKIRKVEEAAEKIAKDVELEVIHDICLSMIKEEVEKTRVIEHLGQKIVDDVIEQFILKECKHIFDQELHTQKKLHNICQRIENRIIVKYFKVWRQHVQKRKLQRKALNNTPVWLPKRSFNECARSMYSKEQNLVIQNMKIKRCKYSPKHEQREYLDPIEVEIYRGLQENAKLLDVKLGSKIFWKMIISWPNLTERILLERYKKIMNEYLCPQDFSMDEFIKVYKPNPSEALHICIKHSEDVIHDEDVAGLDGLFFIITNDEDSKSASRRLTKTVLARSKLMPIPLYLLFFCERAVVEHSEFSEALKSLLRSGYLSDYKMHYEKAINESNILNITQAATLWIAVNRSPPIPLEMSSLSEVIDNCLTDELWLRISGHASFNSNLSTALENPEFVIKLHNEAVEHLVDIILDPENIMYTDFPAEFRDFLPHNPSPPCSFEYINFDWKNEENREGLARTIQSFSLPPWPFGWPVNDIIELHKDIVRYCQETSRNSNYPSMACTILSKIYVTSDDQEIPNFVFIILEILKEKLRSLDPEMRVVYNKNHIKCFRSLPWWFESGTLKNYSRTNLNELESSERTIAQRMKRRRLAEDPAELSKLIDKYSYILEDKDDPFESIINPDQMNETHDTSEKIEELLSQQQLLSSKLNDKLEAALR